MPRGETESKYSPAGERLSSPDDLEILVLGPALPPATVHHLKPFGLNTAFVTAHKDRSQRHVSFGKAVFSGRMRLRERGVPCLQAWFDAAGYVARRKAGGQEA